MACQAVSKLLRIRSEIIPRGNIPIHALRGWMQFNNLIQGGPTNLKEFFNIVGEIGETVRTCVETANMGDQEKGTLERGIIIQGAVPETLRKAIETMCGTILDKVLDSVTDPGRLVSAPDYWLWHSDDRRGMSDAKPNNGIRDHRKIESIAHWIDVITKTTLSATKGPLRRCTRCGSCTAVVPSMATMSHPWLLQMSRTCVCGGAWIVVEGDGKGGP